MFKYITPSHRSDMNNSFSDDYILIRGNIMIAFKNNISIQKLCTFTNCVTKLDRTTIDDAEDLGWLCQYKFIRIQFELF